MKPKNHRFPVLSSLARPLFLTSCSAVLMWTGAGLANAATFKWDSGNTANGATIDSGSGAWNKTAGNIVWNNAGTNAVWADANDAVFEGTDGTHAITVETGIAATKLVFNSGTYTLGASGAQIITLTPGSTPAIEIASGKTAVIGNNVTVQKTVANSGTGGMTIGAVSGGTAGKLSIATGATVKSTASGANSAMYLSGNGLVVDVSGSLGRTSNAVAATGNNDDTTHIGNNAADNVTVNLKPGGSYATGGRTVRIGSTGTAVMNVDGGAFSVNSNTSQGHVYLGYNAGSNATVNVSAGSFSTNPGNPGAGAGQLIVGLNATSTALLSVTGGTVNAHGRMVVSGGSTNATATVSGTGEIIVGGLGVSLGESAAAAKGTINLDNGGTLTTPSINRVLGEGTMNFNGGILKATKANTTFLQGLTLVNVHDGGATVNTNGFDITVAQGFSHSSLPGAAATDGGLTKTGAGILTLTSPDHSYTGPTTVNGGTLFADSVSLPSHAGLSIGAGGTFRAKGSVTSAGSLTSQGGLSTVNADINTLAISGGINLSNSTISLDLADGVADDITAGGAATVTGSNTINISLVPGEPLTSATYTLMTSAGGLNAANFVIGTRPPGFNTFSLSTPTPNALVLNVTSGNATPSTAYWTGKASSTGSPSDVTNLWGYGSALGVPMSNWSTTANGLTDPLQIPGATTNVIFTATNATHTAGTLATKLDAAYAVNSLAFDVPAATGITATAIDTNGFTLSVGGNGISVASGSNSGASIGGTGSVSLIQDLSSWSNQSNSKALTVSTPVVASQANTLLALGGAGTGGITLSGGLGNGPGSLGLSVESAGTVTLAGACSHTGVTEVVSGKLVVQNTSTFTSKLTLTAAAADAVTFQQDTQNLVLPNQPISGAGGIVKTGAGSLTLASGASSHAGGTMVSGGTLVLNAGSVGSGAGTAPGDISTVGLMDPANVVTVNNGATLSIGGTAPFGNSTLLQQYAASVVLNQGATLKGNAFVAFIPNLTLNGASVQAGDGNTTGGFNTNLGLVGTVTVGGSIPSTISTTGSGGNAKISLGGATTGNNGTTFNVADVTGNADADLTISSIIRNAGTTAVPLVSPLVKTGAGTLLLTAINQYTGSTTVNGGTLSLAIDSLADTSDILIGNSGTLHLAHGVQDTVLSLTIGGVLMPAGVYGTGGISNAHITGPGSLLVLTGASGTAYDTWASQIPNAADRDRTDDPDGDGFNNLSEFLFGTSPVAVNGALSQATRPGANVLVRWTQRQADGSYQLQSSTTPANPWDDALTVDPAITIGDEPGAPDGYQNKVATVPVNGARKFLRIFASE